MCELVCVGYELRVSTGSRHGITYYLIAKNNTRLRNLHIDNLTVGTMQDRNSRSRCIETILIMNGKQETTEQEIFKTPATSAPLVHFMIEEDLFPV
jgi:hypothetical protein